MLATIAALHVLVSPPVSSGQLLWSQILLIVAAALFLVAFLFLLLRKEWPKAAPHAPTLIALAFVLLALALLLDAL
jgi:hypothetical protein